MRFTPAYTKTPGGAFVEPIIETRASGAATPDALPCPGRWYRVVLMPSHYSTSASNRLPGVIALEFAPGQCQVLPLNRLPLAHFAAGELAFFIRERRRLPPLPFANLTLVVTLLLAFLIPLRIRQPAAFGCTRQARDVRTQTVRAIRMEQPRTLRLRQRRISGRCTGKRKHSPFPGAAQGTLIRRIAHDHQIILVGLQSVDMALDRRPPCGGAGRHLSVRCDIPAPPRSIDESGDARIGEAVQRHLRRLTPRHRTRRRPRRRLRDRAAIDVVGHT